MSIISRLTSICERARRKWFPTAHELMVAKWNRDGGNQVFRFSYDLTPASVVVDLGGFEGQWASDIFSMYACRVHIFEPVASFYEGISRRFGRNPHISLWRYGAGGTARTEQIRVCGDGSSVLRGAGDTETIEIVDICDWLDLQKIEHIDLLKLNIEGAEYEVLERMIDSRMIDRVTHIQVQFHRISPDSDARVRQIQEALKRTHVPTYQYAYVWESWSRIPSSGSLS